MCTWGVLPACGVAYVRWAPLCGRKMRREGLGRNCSGLHARLVRLCDATQEFFFDELCAHSGYVRREANDDVRHI